MQTIRETRSLCPVCLAQLPARIDERGGSLYMVRDCPAHGHFENIIWRGKADYREWTSGLPPSAGEEKWEEDCPGKCGLCDAHKNGTCCTILELTGRCNLHCRHCFAAAGNGVDRPFDDITRDLDALTVPGQTLVQLSGGEPAIHPKLPEIIRHAAGCGCKYIQLNTNGLRLAEDEAFVRTLAEAGLSFVFLQFDGLEDTIHETIRGRALLREKLQAIDNCAKYNLGVVLVVTVVPGVNDHALGDILRFGISMSPAVRGVHFQPVTHLGRRPTAPGDRERFTLDDLISAVCGQSGGLIQKENLAPSRCDHPLCGFHGDFIALPGEFRPLTNWKPEAACCTATAGQNREFVGRRWLREAVTGESCCCPDPSTLDGFLDSVKSYGFTVTSMAFQDEGNIDIERLHYCSTHVYRDGRFTPLCAYYLSPAGNSECLHPGGLALTERALSLAALPRGARAADLGCGAGASLELMRKKFGLDAVGVEPDEQLRQRGSAPVLNACAEALPFAGESLDAILAECVFSVFRDPAAAMKEAHRVLRKGGLLIISDLYARAQTSGDTGLLTRHGLHERGVEAGFIETLFEDHTPELLEMAAQAAWDGKNIAACAGRSKETLKKLKCGYYLMIQKKAES